MSVLADVMGHIVFYVGWLVMCLFIFEGEWVVPYIAGMAMMSGALIIIRTYLP